MQETTKTLTRTEITEQYLAHHGIKGQRWGVRRFQNSDGSLTAAGKKRRGVSDKDDKNAYIKAITEKHSNKSFKDSTRDITVDVLKSRVDQVGKKLDERLEKDSKLYRTTKDLAKITAEKNLNTDELTEFKNKALKSGNADDVLRFKNQLTNQELQSAVQRIQWESQLKDYSAKNMRTTQQKIEDAISKTKTGISAITTTMDLYNSVAKLANSFGAKLPVLDGGKSMSEKMLAKEVRQMRADGWETTSQNLGNYSLEAIKIAANLAGNESRITDWAKKKPVWDSKEDNN